MRPSDEVRQQSLTKVWYSHIGLRKSATNSPIRRNVSSGCNIGLHTLVYRKHRLKLHGESREFANYENARPRGNEICHGQALLLLADRLPGAPGSMDLSYTDAAMNIVAAVPAPTRPGTLLTDAKLLFSRRAVH
jgi:hypothetical protein